MAFLNLAAVFIILAFTQYGIMSPSSASIAYPPSSVAYNQLRFWTKNVRNNMPEVLLSKLSGMSKRDCSYFNSLLSMQSFVADADFCSTAGLVCSYSDHDHNLHVTNASQPYVANASRESELVTYRTYAYDANASRESELVTYRTYAYVANASRESELVTYRTYAYVANASRESELIKYGPYGPYVANSSQASKLIEYMPYGPYAANASHVSELIKYRPYGPYVANASEGSEQKSYRPYATKASLREGLDDLHVFFRLSVLKIGNKVHIPKVLNHSFPRSSFLPFPLAKKILMSSNDMKRIFPESFETPITRDAILSTIFSCNAPAIKGEKKRCSRSLEDLIGFSKAVLGKNRLSVLTTESGKGSGADLQIDSIKQFNVEKLVACHELFFPFATYFCHFLPSTHLYSIALVEGETKVHVNKVLAICHMDTSAIPADHISLRILNLSPGQGEVCHWMLETDLIWINEGESTL